MKQSDKPRPPAYLSAAAKRWWNALTSEFIFDSPDGVMRLEAAVSSWDEWNKNREIVEKEGSVIIDRFGQKKVHPAVVVCRDSKISMLRALRELALDILPPGKVGRPPGS